MKYQPYARHNFSKLPTYHRIDPAQRKAISVVSEVLPFKTNNYVVDELIDWDNYQTDPMYILNFPQKEMLSEAQFDNLIQMLDQNRSKSAIARYVHELRMALNPHPAGQLEHNVPTLNGERLTGIQHKYRETMLFFPSQGQTCHAYCTFCFRWPQFIGLNELKFAMKQPQQIVAYLKANPEISDLLITGGDPMVMKASVFKKYLDVILAASLPQLKTIRIGTKSLSFWPYRFLTDPDTDELLAQLRRISDAGIHLAFMSHFNHWKELETDALKEAVVAIRNTGAQIRTQSPLLRHINDDAAVWAKMWRQQVDRGMIPYYMFLARDTGAKRFFGLEIQKALGIFIEAYSQVSGVCRTVRGPSMSTGPGKVRVIGVSEIKGEKVYALEFLQGRNPDWVGIPFYASYDPKAQWLDDLKPAFGASAFFFEEEYQKLLKIETLPGPALSAENKQSA